MVSMHMLTSVAMEYGLQWMINRSIYSGKIKMMNAVPVSSRLFEHTPPYPLRTNLFNINISALEKFIQSLEEDRKKELITVADKATNGVIYGFSSIDLDFGKILDWQLNPLTGKRCDERLPWYRIPDFDVKRGDIKVIWEASRFSHFITLARAYILTNDKKYYIAFSSQLEDWLKNNQYSYGANFKCGQECSLRMVNALLAYTIFKNSKITTDTDESNIKDLIDRCYRKVLSNFFYAYKCIKNNHTISELMGMIVGAWCCDDDINIRKAMGLLDEVVREQFTVDGGYKQFSFNYQRLALQDLEVVLSIEETIGVGLNKVSKERIKNAAILLYQCQDASGDVPNYGSNDGAMVFPVNSCGYRDFKSVINTSYTLVTGKQLYSDGAHQEELIWFSNGRDITNFNMEKVDKVSVSLSDAGLYTLRNGDSFAMVVLNDYHYRPAHMDQLHLDLWIKGVNVFCDCGTYSYASDLGRELNKNGSHNTVSIEGMDQMNIFGPFIVYDWTKRIKVISTDCCFEGIMESKNGYRQHRRIEKRDNGFVIRDTVRGTKEAVHVMFHTPCKVKIDGNIATLYKDGDRLCELRTDGRIKLTESCRSLYYLKKESISCVCIEAKCDLEINTIIEF